METIILHSKEKDIELLKELRRALIKKGFTDDLRWNDVYERNAACIVIYHIEGNDTFDMYSFIAPAIKEDDITIPVSRNDFQTMFLLY